jgi:hypothetical protein
MKAKVVIERGLDGTYDACFDSSANLGFGLLGQGDTVKDTIEDFYNSKNEMKAYYDEISKPFPVDLDFVFTYDVASFLAYYSNVMSLAGLQHITGVNQGQLSHYVTGHRKPSKKTVEKIEKSLHSFAEEIGNLHLV